MERTGDEGASNGTETADDSNRRCVELDLFPQFPLRIWRTAAAACSETPVQGAGGISG